MVRFVLVDGYNVIRRTSALARAERISLQHGRDALLTQLAARYGRTEHHIIVVFDGDGTAETHDTHMSVRVIFTPAHESADDCIVRMAHGARQRGDQVVICTDDGAIRAALGGLAPQVTHHGGRALGEQLGAAPRLLEKQHRHRAFVRDQLARDADADAPTTPRNGNPRRSPKRPRH